ncbi:MAG: NUDIX domain-containing protein [Solirubrobacterales bacterium]|nr:NUDIX domain-containing protein [Solirubrobacterales bacterium]MBV8941759.1 NUDIX domain-containing protein [Solirubrobacterales bacterium]MBV9165030.1 NUDIX domain-containing protein [Solirubrobacterales bacterium]MBV9535353.1 NUDIX domain-containing protein [Solirubrobacterales bacterium]
MQIPLALRRQAYRVAHHLLRAWWFVRRPDHEGVKCVLNDADRVLLVRHTYGDRRWDLPGGSVRRSEVAQETATREMEEELGIRVEHWYYLCDLLALSYSCHDTLHCFQAEVDDPALTLNRAELQAARWFPERELPAEVGRHVRPILARSFVLRPSVRGEQADA